MDADREIELKLAVPDCAWPDLVRSVAQAGATRDGKPKTLRSVYFDTDDEKLRASGFVLRIRSDGERNIQTVKSNGPHRSVIERGEWEAAVPGNRPVATAPRNSPLPHVLGSRELKRLRPIFTVDVEREVYVLDRGETVIEIALDRGVVHRNSAQQSFSEAEFELKRGATQELFALVREIGESVPALLSLTTKAERGHRLGDGTGGQPVMRIDYAVRRDMDAVEIARAIAQPCLVALLDNLAMLMAGAGGEALHQSRVSVRRLQALLTLLRSAFGWKGGVSVRAELKWLADLLAHPREIDVFIRSALSPAAEDNPDAPGFDALREAFRRHRDEAYEATIQALHSPRLLGLSVDLLTCFGGVPDSTLQLGAMKKGRKGSAWRCIEKALRRRLRSLLDDSVAIDELTVARQHAVRIRAKKLRYMLEPFAESFVPKRSRAILASLQAMQDTLGAINDERVNRALVLAHARNSQSGRDGADASLFAAGIVAATCRGRRAKCLSQAAAARKRLARATALGFR